MNGTDYYAMSGFLPAGMTVPSTDPILLCVGQTQTVCVWGQVADPGVGLQALAGDIKASNVAGSNVPASSDWHWWYRPSSQTNGFAGELDDTGNIDDNTWNPIYTMKAPGGKPGPAAWTYGSNGQILGLGSGQGSLTAPQTTFANSNNANVASRVRLLGWFTATIVNVGQVTLNWVDTLLAGTTHVGHNGWYTTNTTLGGWPTNDPGDAVAPGNNPLISHGLMISEVPEPATLAMLALGLLVARRRQA